MVASALLGVATVVIGGLAAREIGGRKLGLLTALLLAVYPNIWRHDGMVMSETAAIFTTVLTIWFAYRFWWNPTFRRALALGVAVALATTARSELALLAVFLVVPLVLWKRDQTFKQRARWLGAAGLGFLLLLTPFLAFNYARFGKPTFLSAQLEVTLATANCPGTYEGDWKGYWDLSCAKAILKANDIDDPTDPRTPPPDARCRQAVRRRSPRPDTRSGRGPVGPPDRRSITTSNKSRSSTPTSRAATRASRAPASGRSGSSAARP